MCRVRFPIFPAFHLDLVVLPSIALCFLPLCPYYFLRSMDSVVFYIHSVFSFGCLFFFFGGGFFLDHRTRFAFPLSFLY